MNLNKFLIKGIAITLFCLTIGHASNITLYQIHFDLMNFIITSLMIVGLGFLFGYLIQWRFDQYEEVKNEN